MNYAKDMYSKIADFLSWVDPNIMKELNVEMLDNVLDEITNIETIIKS